MSVELATLLDELARRHARGEPLDVEGLLAQAGDRSDELAPMIETFLVRAPRRTASAQTLAYVRALDDPPILRARVAKALRVDEVVDAIMAACRLQPDSRAKVRRYYQQLEGGVLDPEPVATSVWDAISALLGRTRESLSVPHAGVPTASPMYRADRLFEPGEVLVVAERLVEPEPPDEVDALFLGASPEA